LRAPELMPANTMTLSPCSTSSGQSTIGERIRLCAETQPDHAAVESPSFASLSYHELQVLVDDVRVALRLAGLSRSARIAIAMPNGPQAALAIVAVTCSAVSIPLNPRQTLREIETCFSALRPDAIFLMKGNDSPARQAAVLKGIAVIEVTQSKESGLGFSIVEPQTRTIAAPDEPDEPDPDAPAFILQTSGTAAEPKLIPFSHRNMLAAAARLQAWFDLTPQDRCLSVSPPFYSHGLKVTVFTPFLTGGTVTFPTDASKFDYSEWFGVLKPTWYSAGPTLHRLVFDQTQGRADVQKGHSLRFILSGGAPLPRNVLEGLQHTLGVPVVEHYGSSEAAQIAANLPAPGHSKLGTCGVPWPGTVKIVGEDGRPLPPYEQGEILVGGPTLISGYLNAPELNRAVFVDGWFKTGDIGSFDEDGFLTLHGRISDVINRGGEKISPIEIDEALMRHPAVAEAVAFSVPHSRLGEDIAAAVVLRPSMTATSVELRRYLQDQLALFKVPRQIVIRDHLPKGMAGKILRRQLTESFQKNAAAATQVAAPPSAESILVYQLMRLWQLLLNIAPPSLDDDFFDKGGDSLLAIEMLAELELLTGQTIPSSILFEATTIRQLAQKLSEQTNLQTKYLIQMNSTGSQPPIIYFHGDFNGIGYSSLMLAKLLGSDQPLLIVAPHGSGDELIPNSIEAMAADRLPLILNAQPDGPYRLCGNCLGGIVAFEVARMLLSAGKKVEMVVMIDAPTINARRSVQLLFSTMKRARPIIGSFTDFVMAWTWFRFAQVQQIWNITWARRWNSTKVRVRKLATAIASIFGNQRVTTDHLSKPSVEVSRLGNFTDARTSRYTVAMSNYFPRPLAVHVIYFNVDFNAKAWRRLSPDLETIRSSGTHDLLEWANIAEHLRARLQNSN
jgi:oxalate---CoA ligase